MADKKPVLTASRLKDLIHYNPGTGIFTWKVIKSRSANIGSVAGGVNFKGYITIGIDGKRYTAHRLAFLFMNGEFPSDEVDHANGIRIDNRWSNLREATGSENQQNHKINCNNTSGYLGVCKFTGTNRWLAQIAVNGRNKYLGLFDTPKAAHAAYLAAKAKLHKFQPVPRRIERIAA
jgi:hypothetical protein